MQFIKLSEPVRESSTTFSDAAHKLDIFVLTLFVIL